MIIIIIGLCVNIYEQFCLLMSMNEMETECLAKCDLNSRKLNGILQF